MYKKNIFYDSNSQLIGMTLSECSMQKGIRYFVKNVRVEAGGEINEHCKGKIRNPF